MDVFLSKLRNPEKEFYFISSSQLSNETIIELPRKTYSDIMEVNVLDHKQHKG